MPKAIKCWNCGNVLMEELKSKKNDSTVSMCTKCKYPNNIKDWEYLKEWEKKTGKKVYQKESLDSMYGKFLEFQKGKKE